MSSSHTDHDNQTQCAWNSNLSARRECKYILQRIEVPDLSLSMAFHHKAVLVILKQVFSS